MARFSWFSKAEEGEKLHPDDDEFPAFEFLAEPAGDDSSPPLCASEPVDGCWSCAQRGGVSPFHAEIPRLS